MEGLRFAGDGKNRARRLIIHVFAAFQAVWTRRGRETSELRGVVTSAIDRDKFKAVAKAIVSGNALNALIAYGKSDCETIEDKIHQLPREVEKSSHHSRRAAGGRSRGAGGAGT